jgi:flavin-dependent dehydrogenase
MTGPDAANEPIASHYDVVVVGGGPAGTTFANFLAREGRSVLVVEKSAHPRFSVGESLLPKTMEICEDLGILEEMSQTFVRKFGAYFDFQDCRDPEYYHFPSAARSRFKHAYEVERSRFDKMLWDAASAQGARCEPRTEVVEWIREGDVVEGVRIKAADGEEREVRARLVADCAGRRAMLGSELGLRVPDRTLNKVGLVGHWEGAFRSSGDDEGTLCTLATDWGWVWLIPFLGDRVSVGAVIDNAVFAQRIKGSTPADLLEELIQETPGLRNRLASARRVGEVESLSNFSFKCSRYSGPGWVLLGDAAAFLDPVFSSGVHLAMTGARTAAKEALRALARGDGRVPTGSFRSYERRAATALRVFRLFIYAWYRPEFRKVFMRIPRGRPGVEWLYEEILSVLTGHVYNPWRALPPIYLLLGIARIQAFADRFGKQGPARPSLPRPA